MSDLKNDFEKKIFEEIKKYEYEFDTLENYKYLD